MALKSTIQFHGVSIPDAYIRVCRHVFTSKTDCRAYIEVYAAEVPGGDPDKVLPLTLEPVDFVYDFDSPLSLHAQAYAAAKLRPEFADATDV